MEWQDVLEPGWLPFSEDQNRRVAGSAASEVQRGEPAILRPSPARRAMSQRSSISARDRVQVHGCRRCAYPLWRAVHHASNETPTDGRRPRTRSGLYAGVLVALRGSMEHVVGEGDNASAAPV